MTNLHVFTGSKGGAGKTLMSLCATVHFYQNARRVLVIDANSTNPTLSTILKRLGGKKILRQDDDAGFELGTIGERLMYARKLETYKMPDGISGFVAEYIHKALESEWLLSFDPSDIVVDTNLQIANFAALAEGNSPGQEVSGRVTQPRLDEILTQVRLRMWLLWLGSSWESAQELTAMKNGIRALECGAVGSFQSEDDDKLIHIYNPYTNLKEFGFLELAEYIRDYYSPYSRIMRANTRPPISFEFISDKVRKRISEWQADGPLDRTSYPNAVAEVIAGNGKLSRPRNFFPFGLSSPAKNYFSDIVADSGPQKLEDIPEFLGVTYQKMDAYISSYFH